MVPCATFVSNGTCFDSSTNRRDDPSASVSNPGSITSGVVGFGFCAVGVRCIRIFPRAGGFDQPKPVAGTTGLAEAVALPAGAGAALGEGAGADEEIGRAHV